MKNQTIDNIVQAWRMSRSSLLNDGATIEQIADAERQLGRQFPRDFKALYTQCNGGSVLQGNLCLYPLDGSEFSVVSASDAHRSCEWPIPPELVLFPDNGQGEPYGLWPSANHSHHTLIVEVGQIFEEGSYSLTGTSLTTFLLATSAYYLRLLEEPAAALELLQLPSMRPADELDEAAYDALFRWVDPRLPALPLSSYEARLTAEDVRREHDRLCSSSE